MVDADPAAEVLALALSRPATLGQGRLVCLDGPAGAGKTTLARRLAGRAARHGSTRVVGMDDLYAGWGGLAAVGAQLDSLLVPLASGSAGRYRRWDWHASSYVEEVVVEPVDLLVLEGVGSFAAAHAALVTALVWVTAPREVRTARVLARDGELATPYLPAWQRDEDRHHAAQGTRARADLVVESARMRTD